MVNNMARTEQLTMGVIGASRKENEHRVPISPGDIPKIPRHLRERIFVEEGYGKRFHVSDEKLKEYFAGVLSRRDIFERCDIILLPKPIKEDFSDFRERQILWGWPHCVQGEAITQLGIDKKLTYIAWEAMFAWRNGVRGLHTFHANNEMAGYASVMHALRLKGITGNYGDQRNAAVISFGSVGRGAVHALQGMGFRNIKVFTQRPEGTVQSPIPGTSHGQYKKAANSEDAMVISETGEEIPMARELAKYDVIVNAILQDTDHPIMFIRNNDLAELKPGTLIVDVSCDDAMGFEFAKPTSFEEPSFEVGEGITYYAVDHSPTYYWRSASEEISRVLVPFIEIVMGGEEAWQNNDAIRRSIEIQDGKIVNPAILRFQNRSPEYPHNKL